MKSTHLALLFPIVVACGAAPQSPPATTTAPTTAKVDKTEPASPVSTTKSAHVEPSHGASAPPLATVLKAAKNSGTAPILIFSTVWCQPCEMIEKDVLPHPDVVKALAPYTLQKYDAEIGEGLTLARKFGVTSFPTMIYVNADGAEITRTSPAQTPEAFIEGLKAKAALAKAGVAKEPDLNDARQVLEAARAEESQAKPDLVKARKLFASASALAQKAKEADVATEASFALLQLDTRAQDRKEHAALLVAFVKKHAPAPKAIDALEGLAGLSTTTPVKLADLNASVAKLETALAAEHKDVDLRRIAAVLKKLGDEAGATRIEALAAKEGSNKVTTPEALRFVDPLGSRFSFSMGGKSSLSAQDTFAGATTRQMVEDCRHLPHPNEPVSVRVYPANGAITKAVVLDPELPAELRTCLEKSAVASKNVPATGVPEKAELHVMFAPQKK
jgi:hypothetical protein